MDMMKRALCFLYKCFSCPVAIGLGMIAISVIALGGALSSEVFLGLEPCQLCIYQRWPFVITAAIGVLILLFRNKKTAAALLTGFGGLTFLMNSAIALYHTGVEQKWWVSEVEGCSAPASFTGEEKSWIDNIMETPSVPCDVIPWQDPVFGLSMANYNVILCFGLFMCCMFAAYRLYSSSSSVSQ
jgi:disulfide bond formation protein DsbB